jgi:septum formation inhibitor MinC
MSKIAIISRPDQGVLIDVSGCLTMQEAVQHLSSTLQVSSQFWKGLAVDLNLGTLTLNDKQVAQLLALSKGLGVVPKIVYSTDAETCAALKQCGVKIGDGKPQVLAGMLPSAETLPDGQPSSKASLDTSDANCQLAGATISVLESDEAIIIDQSQTELDTEADNSSPVRASDTVLYLKQTLRSGQAVSHKGHLVIIGDVNAGAEVVAEGDITIWGSLRGVAHAGVGGNTLAEIRALKLQPIQIRIADSIARSPDPSQMGLASTWGPESARLVDGKIRILRNSLD